MISPAAFAAAAVAGLVGSGHCAGMCGGMIVSLRQAVAPVTVRRATGTGTGPGPTLDAPRPTHGGWNLSQLGRLCGYALAGAIAGSLGSFAEFAQTWLPIQAILLGLFNTALVLLGLQIAGLLGRWRGLEELGGRLWQRLQPHLRGLWPPRTWRQHLVWGMAWGLMPCALVYSVLPLALLSGSARDGALLMLAFGLGTLPVVELLGQGALLAQARLPRLFWRRSAGLLLVGFGLAGAARAVAIGEHAPRWLGAALSWCA